MFTRLNQKTNPQSVWLHNEGANVGEDVQDDVRRPDPPAGGRVWRLCWRWGLALCHTVLHLPIQVGGQVVKAKVLPAHGVIHKRRSQRWEAGTNTLLLFFVVVVVVFIFQAYRPKAQSPVSQFWDETQICLPHAVKRMCVCVCLIVCEHVHACMCAWWTCVCL